MTHPHDDSHDWRDARTQAIHLHRHPIRRCDSNQSAAAAGRHGLRPCIHTRLPGENGGPALCSRPTSIIRSVGLICHSASRQASQRPDRPLPIQVRAQHVLKEQFRSDPTERTHSYHPCTLLIHRPQHRCAIPTHTLATQNLMRTPSSSKSALCPAAALLTVNPPSPCT